jgi:hypothetical protein
MPLGVDHLVHSFILRRLQENGHSNLIAGYPPLTGGITATSERSVTGESLLT